MKMTDKRIQWAWKKAVSQLYEMDDADDTRKEYAASVVEQNYRWSDEFLSSQDASYDEVVQLFTRKLQYEAGPGYDRMRAEYFEEYQAN